MKILKGIMRYLPEGVLTLFLCIAGAVTVFNHAKSYFSPTSAKDPHELVLFMLGFLLLAVGMQRIAHFLIVEQRLTSAHNMLGEIRNSLHAPTYRTYQNRDEVYAETAKLLALASATGGTYILLAALPRFDEKRLPDKNPIVRRFEREMKKCIQTCEVREIYNITNEDRLDMIEGYLKDGESTRNYEVRAFAASDAPLYLSAFVIGEEDVILGVEDEPDYRIQKAIHLKGKDPVKIITTYFNHLWHQRETDDKILYELKSKRGIRQDQINRLREQLRLKRTQNHPTT